MENSKAIENKALALANLFSVLANPYRVQILQILGAGEKNVSQILELIDVTPTALSNHLTKLKNSGVVGFRREHRHLFYSVKDARINELLNQVSAVLN